MTISLLLAEQPSDKRAADSIVAKHHSYVPSIRVVGRCLKYLCFSDEVLVGTFWVGSFMKPTPKDMLRAMGLSQAIVDRRFNSFADNKKFCMAVSIPNAGSQVLKHVRARVADDWKRRYGDELLAMFTTIGSGKNGAVYRADNWEVVGHTAGLPPKRSAVSMKWDDAATISQRFVKPTGEDKKLILGTARLAGRRSTLASVHRTVGADLL